jgi:hypothetical protein
MRRLVTMEPRCRSGRTAPTESSQAWKSGNKAQLAALAFQPLRAAGPERANPRSSERRAHWRPSPLRGGNVTDFSRRPFLVRPSDGELTRRLQR